MNLNPFGKFGSNKNVEKPQNINQNENPPTSLPESAQMLGKIEINEKPIDVYIKKGEKPDLYASGLIDPIIIVRTILEKEKWILNYLDVKEENNNIVKEFFSTPEGSAYKTMVKIYINGLNNKEQ